MAKWLLDNLNWLVPMLFTAAIAVVVAHRYRGARRSRISVVWETVALLNRHADRADLEVLHKGEPVSEPHLVTIEIQCRKPNDITKDNFHDAEPWKIVFAGATPLSVAGDDIGATVDVQQRALLIPPRHLAAGVKHRLTVVTKERAESLSTTALVNTDLRVRTVYEQRRRQWFTPVYFGMGLLSAALVWTTFQGTSAAFDAETWFSVVALAAALVALWPITQLTRRS